MEEGDSKAEADSGEWLVVEDQKSRSVKLNQLCCLFIMIVLPWNRKYGSASFLLRIHI